MKIQFRNSGIFILLVAIVTIIFSSCKTGNKDSSNDEWNKGTITIATDENLKNIALQLVQIYENEYDQAKIILDFQQQDKIISDFMSGKIKSMIINRNLTKNEIEISNQNQKIDIKENIIADNGVALIAGKNFKDSVINIKNIKNYLQPNTTIKLVFDNKQSGIAKFILQKENLDVSLFKNALVVNNTDEVIEYVNRNSSSIGFIPFNYISDTHTKVAKEILSKVKTLAIQHNDTISAISQQCIYEYTYPLLQPVNIVLGKNPEIVGTAFVNWLCKERAAKILQKAGLVPRFLPNRNIIVEEELKTN